MQWIFNKIKVFTIGKLKGAIYTQKTANRTKSQMSWFFFATFIPK